VAELKVLALLPARPFAALLKCWRLAPRRHRGCVCVEGGFHLSAAAPLVSGAFSCGAPCRHRQTVLPSYPVLSRAVHRADIDRQCFLGRLRRADSDTGSAFRRVRRADVDRL
jgi:hypothetical protein